MGRHFWEGRRRFLKQSAAVAGSAVAASVLPHTTASANEKIVLAGWGGQAQWRLTEAISKPFTEETGIAVQDVVAVTTMVSQIKAQVDNNNPLWDVAVLTGPEAFQLAAEGYLAELVYDPVIRQEMPESLLGKHCAAQLYAMFVPGWSATAFENRPEPRTWADFWNVVDFPGRRTACGWFPYYMIEIALMADGVDKADVYPLTPEKIEAGFAKIRELQPHINVWWSSGGQSAQLFVDQEVDFGMMYTSRLREVLNAGHAVKWSIAQPLLEAQWVAIPKTAPNIEAAQKWVNSSLRKETQARMVRLKGSPPPTNPATFDLLTDEERASGLGEPEAIKNGLLLDSEFWWSEYEKYVETWEMIKAG